MSKMKIAVVVVAVVMALSVSAIVFAQTPTPPNPPKTATPSPYAQTFWQTLADKLGVTVDKLQSAVRDALKATVDKMLSDDKLTQQQADQAKSRIDSQTFDKLPFGPFFGGRHFGPFPGKLQFGSAALDAAAQKLGMTTQDLMTELRNGKTLADVAKEKNVNSDDLKTAIVNAINAQIDQAVKDGKLTQTQADKIKAQVAQINLDQSFGRGLFGGEDFGKRRHNWFKGNRSFGPRGQPAPQGTTS